MAVGLQNEDLYLSQDSAPAGVKFLEALAAQAGAVEEGKQRRQKQRMDEQTYYDTLRKNGYTAQQAVDIVEGDKGFKEIGEPSDPRFLESQDLDARKKRADTLKSEADLTETQELAKARKEQAEAEAKTAVATAKKAEFDAENLEEQQKIDRKDSALARREQEISIKKAEIELERLQRGDTPELRKKEAEAEKAEIELEKLRQERDAGFIKDMTDQEKTARRSKSQAIELIKIGSYRNDDGKLRDFKNKKDMITFLIDEFSGKIDFSDPEIQGAIKERFPDKEERRGFIAKLFGSGKGTGDPTAIVEAEEAEEPEVKADADGKVAVVETKTGKRGRIPKANVKKALASGRFKLA